MTLQSSGAISLANVNVELGKSSTATITMNDTDVRTLAGVASGAISMSNFYGKSNAPVWTPNGGASAGSPVALTDLSAGLNNAVKTITCTQSAVWSYVQTDPDGTATVSVANNGTSTSITFTLPGHTDTNVRTAAWNLNSTASGTTKYWTVTLQADGNA